MYRAVREKLILPELCLFTFIWSCQSDANMRGAMGGEPVTKQSTSFCWPTAVEMPSCREPSKNILRRIMQQDDWSVVGGVR